MANITLTLAGLVFLLASVGARLHVLLDWPGLRGGIDTFFLLAAAWAAIVLLIRRPLWAITLGATFGLLAANAFSSLYWPSLRPGIPIQDFLLADQVSANYSWNQVLLYLKTTGVMLTIGLAARVCWVRASRNVRATFGAMVGAALVLNLAVIGIQNADVTWLADGSGSAVEARRAPGLLEDSGASTVFMGAVMAGLAFFVLLGTLSPQARMAWGVALVVGAAIGTATVGRAYLSSFLLTSTIGLWLLAVRSAPSAQWRRRTVIGGLVAAAAGIFVAVAYAAGGVSATLADPGTALNRMLLLVDPYRAPHYKAMTFAFADSPVLGAGLGTFYANLFHYREAALAGGGVFLPDPPSSIYFVLGSELGLAGVLVVVAALGWLVVQLVRLTGPDAHPGLAPWPTFGVGIAVALAISLNVGIHVIFWSVPSLLILIAVGGAESAAPRWPWFRRVWGTALVLLAITCANLWATAPRAPEFRWEARGTPQVPVSLVVPIWPEQLEGIWAASGAEFLYDGKPVELHIERAREFYPMTLSIKVYDRAGQLLATSDQVFDAPTGADPGRLIQVPFGDDVNAACSTNITPDSYCTFRMTTTPEWTLDGQPVAALWVTRNLR